MKEYLEKIIEGYNLTFDEAYKIMFAVMSGEVNNSQIASLLTALRMKKETPEEVAGFVQAMREKMIKINCDKDLLIDVCGTGGDGSGTFNISTSVAFVAAGAGIHVAKHGNRSISSKSGSSDVLHELGVDVQLSPELSEKALNEIGIAFLFAPLYHPAMKHVAPIRKELEFKSIFNILGPLTNPAQVKKQLLGTFNDEVSLLMANALKYLNMGKVLFVCSSNKYDEVTLTDISKIIETEGQSSKHFYEIDFSLYGLPKINLNDIKGNSAKENAEIIYKVFSEKEKSPAYYVIVANAALAIKSAGMSNDLAECISIAEESILSGKTLDKLNQLKDFGEKYK